MSDSVTSISVTPEPEPGVSISGVWDTAGAVLSDGDNRLFSNYAVIVDDDIADTGTQPIIMTELNMVDGNWVIREIGDSVQGDGDLSNTLAQAGLNMFPQNGMIIV